MIDRNEFIIIPDSYETDLIAALCLAAHQYADPSRLIQVMYCVNPKAGESLEASLTVASASRTEEPA